MRIPLVFVHIWDDDGQNIVLSCPSYAYGLLKHICMLSGVKFEKV